MTEHDPALKKAALTGILVVAIILRFFNLGLQSLWYDEIVTLQISSHTFLEIWGYMMGGEYNPPLFYWVAHYALPILGGSEFGLRFVPMIFGILAIIPTYYLGKRIGGMWTGMGAAWMMTLSSYAIFYSQEARTYSLVLLLMTAGLYFYLGALETNRTRDWALAVLLFVLSVWAHFYVMVFLAVAFAGTPLILGKPLNRNVLTWWAMIGFGSLPIIGTAAGLAVLRATTNVPWGYQGLDVLVESYIEAAGAFFPVSIIFIALIVFSLVGKPDRRKVFLLAYSFIPLLIGIPVSYYISIVPRYFIEMSAPLYIIIADGWEPFSDLSGFGAYLKKMRPIRWKQARQVGAVLFLGLISLNLVTLPNYYAFSAKDDWRDFAKDVGNVTAPGDAVVSVPGYRVDAEMWYYYDNRSDGTFVYPAYNISEVKEACRHTDGTCWVILTPDTVGKFWEFMANGWVSQHGVHIIDKPWYLHLYRLGREWYV